MFQYPEPGSNRHGHYWPQDFKSGVSTDSTIRAQPLSKAVAKIRNYFRFAKIPMFFTGQHPQLHPHAR